MLSSTSNKPVVKTLPKLFDTHTHFDFSVFDGERAVLARQAKTAGVQAMVIAGYVAKHFNRLAAVQKQLNTTANTPKTFIAAGLHPDFIGQHGDHDIDALEAFLYQHSCVAVGEVGLDTFSKTHKAPRTYTKQKALFIKQLEIAQAHQLPTLLHVRKSHADAIGIIKISKFDQGGIAHSFSGGVQEAKALINLGFKLGITAQATNPNAKKLRAVVQAVGAKHLVVETDCPDMLPFSLHKKDRSNTNVPANLVYVVDTLADILSVDVDELTHMLWKNSLDALHLSPSQLNINFQ